VDLLIILAMLFLNYSRFVSAPGVEVNLAILESSSLQTSVSRAVLTVRRDDLLFFDGRKITPERLSETLAAYLAENPNDQGLLLKVDRSTPTDELFSIFESARSAGFVTVQIAAESPSDARSRDVFQ
jgi:biopolymer transport protein ExbD|tara:strand:+ start:2199 stop:2579 length:381 start_codon:yes stop_codon:yes gene_type:complete